MSLTLVIQPDFPVEPVVREVRDMAQVFTLALRYKARSLVRAMGEKRRFCPLDDHDFDQACHWVVGGDEWTTEADVGLLTFLIRRSVEVLGISNEQEMEINPLLRHMVAYDKACAAEPYFLPDVAE